MPQNKDISLPLIKQKNTFMIHAELNAILNYRGCLGDFKGASIYVTVSPCHECAKIISQVGIEKVVYLHKYHKEDTRKVSEYILGLCGVQYFSLEQAVKQEKGESK